MKIDWSVMIFVFLIGILIGNLTVVKPHYFVTVYQNKDGKAPLTHVRVGPDTLGLCDNEVCVEGPKEWKK